MSSTKKKRFVHGPESEQFEKFKGKRVVISGIAGRARSGVLVWVDVYTLGVQFEDHAEPGIVYKGPGLTVELNLNSNR